MSVTAGAIAAQIKALEGEYGAPLFERHAKGVRLTPLGSKALEQKASLGSRCARRSLPDVYSGPTSRID
ncbi:LysR family transcriptional regulator [Mesorhizobium wenxiniae]|uniref:LysR family transcriptional regulator n=1 Tax=Mesorhizobium wenxiniae TaxID=2014805 RepID=UPI003CC93D25